MHVACIYSYCKRLYTFAKFPPSPCERIGISVVVGFTQSFLSGKNRIIGFFSTAKFPYYFVFCGYKISCIVCLYVWERAQFWVDCVYLQKKVGDSALVPVNHQQEIDTSCNLVRSWL